ncbi:hypothetical protein [Streptococcus sp. O1]
MDWYNDNKPQERVKGMPPVEYREAYLGNDYFFLRSILHGDLTGSLF